MGRLKAPTPTATEGRVTVGELLKASSLSYTRLLLIFLKYAC